MMNSDPTITRIRTVRHHISEQYQHDAQRLIDHYIEREKLHQGRFIELTASVPVEPRPPYAHATQEDANISTAHLVEHRSCPSSSDR